MLTSRLIRQCVSLGKAASAAWTAEGRMPSPSFSLDAQLRFHDKWLKIDLQVDFGMNLIIGSNIVLDVKYRVLLFFKGAGIYLSPYPKAIWLHCWSTFTSFSCVQLYRQCAS